VSQEATDRPLKVAGQFYLKNGRKSTSKMIIFLPLSTAEIVTFIFVFFHGKVLQITNHSIAFFLISYLHQIFSAAVATGEYFLYTRHTLCLIFFTVSC